MFFGERIPEFSGGVEVFDGGRHLIVTFEGHLVAVVETEGGVEDLGLDALG